MSALTANPRDLLEISPELDPEKHKNPNQGDKVPRYTQPQKLTLHILDKNDPEGSCDYLNKSIRRYRDLSGTNMPRGDVPAQKINKEDLSGNLHNAVKKSGGFTVKRKMGDAPKTGYMVSVTQKSEQTHPENGLYPHHIRNYMQKHAKHLAKPNAYLGGWHDPQTKKVYLDVAHHYPKFEDAAKAGRRAKQLAIYDLKNGKSVYLQDGFEPERIYFGQATSVLDIVERLNALHQEDEE